MIALVATGFAIASAPKSEAGIGIGIGFGGPGYYPYGGYPYAYGYPGYGYGYPGYGYNYGPTVRIVHHRPYYWYHGRKIYYARPYRY